MFKILLNSMKKYWWSFLLCIPMAFIAFLVAIFVGGSSVAVSMLPVVLVYVLELIPFSIVDSLPLSIITVSAAQEASATNKNTFLKNFLIFQGAMAALIMAVILLVFAVYCAIYYL